MSLVKEVFKLSGAWFTSKHYYDSMNRALKRLDDKYTMLHYPYYIKNSDSFFQAQKNLTDHCVSLLNPLKNKEILEVGCENGVQAMYIFANYHPSRITGKVIKGWSIYRNWISEIKRKRFFHNLAFRIFYIINARLNIYYLKSRQEYYIFVGNKPVSA